MNETTRAVQRPRALGDLRPGPNQGPFRVAVQAVETRTMKNGSDVFLWLRVGDRTTPSLDARCFDGADRISDFREGVVIELARVSYNERFGLDFSAADYRLLAPGEFAPQEFVRALPREDVEGYWNEFHGFLDSVRDPRLQDLRKRIWGDPELAAKYKWHPSAMGHHHNYLGGNIQHVVGIMRVIEALTTSYPDIDRDLVVFGAAVHDLGKLVEYEVGATIRVTDEGKLKGHLVIGAEMLGRLCEAIRGDGKDFPKDLEDHLVHMVLSHHGRGAWGSPKPPATPEAFLLHHADYIDSQVKGFLQTVEENEDRPDGWARYFDRDIGESRNIRVGRPDA